MVVLLLCVALGLFVAYPYLIYPLLLRLLPSSPDGQPAEVGSLSLLFCTHNEAAVISNKLDNCALLISSLGIQVLAYDDSSTDGTYEEMARSDQIDVVRGSGRAGKARGMQTLVARATGDILIFTDADVIVSPEAVRALAARFGDASVGGVAGSVVSRPDPTRSDVAVTSSIYSRLESRIKLLESRSGNVMGGDGGLFAVRRELYPKFPDHVQDDFRVSMECIFRKSRFTYEPLAVGHDDSVNSTYEELRRKRRIALRAWLTHREMRGQLRLMTRFDRWKYWSHKLARWTGGYALALLALAVGALSACVSLWLLLAYVATGLSLVVVGIRMGGPLRSALDAVAAILATSVGLTEALFGRQMTTWVPPQTRGARGQGSE